MQEITKFIVSFADIPLAPSKPHQHRPAKQRNAAAAAAAGGAGGVRMAAEGESLRRTASLKLRQQQGAAAVAAELSAAAAAAVVTPVEAAVREIGVKLHRQGLREKVHKGERGAGARALGPKVTLRH